MKKINIEQGSPEWEQLRKTHFTGTMLKGICGTPKARQEMLYEVIANRLILGVDSDTDYENPMDRGSRFELEKNVSIERVGFIENDENPIISNSPDGYVKDTDDKIAIEIKCPLGKNYVKLWLTNKVPEEYLYQVFQYFIVNPKLEKLYFVGYHPQIQVHPLHIIEVFRKDILQEIETCKVEQEKFLSEAEAIIKKIIPEL